MNINNGRPQTVTGKFSAGNEPNYVSLKATGNDGNYISGAWMTVNNNPQYFPVQNVWIDGNKSFGNSYKYINFNHRVVGMTENKIGFWEQKTKTVSNQISLYKQKDNVDCWGKCGRKGGKCSFCGKNGYCCSGQNHWNRKGPSFNGDCPQTAIKSIHAKWHVCAVPK